MWTNALRPLVGLGLLMLGLNAQAEVATPQEITGQAQAVATVQEMLVLDAGTALNAERQRYLTSIGQKPGSTAPGASTSVKAAEQSAEVDEADAEAPEEKDSDKPKEDSLEVLGILGFGHQIRADVKINGVPVRFQAGSANPISGPSVAGYRLVSLKIPCVTLSNGSGNKDVCLSRQGGVTQ